MLRKILAALVGRKQPPQHEQMQVQRLVELISDSLAIARASSNPATKVSRLELARQRHKDLCDLLHLNPTLQAPPQLASQGQEIELLSKQFSCNALYAHADESLRDYSHQASSPHYANQARAGDISGWKFFATLQLRTPLRILLSEGKFCPVPNTPPSITQELWEGIWMPKAYTWRELGIDKDDFFKLDSRASDIGQVPADGGDYLQFLIAVRKIVEKEESIESRLDALRQELHRPQWKEYVVAHQGHERIYAKFFPKFLETIPSLPATVKQSLYDLGLETAASLGEASDAALLAIKGIGPAKLKIIRECCASAPEPHSLRVDVVRR